MTCRTVLWKWRWCKWPTSRGAVPACSPTGLSASSASCGSRSPTTASCTSTCSVSSPVQSMQRAPCSSQPRRTRSRGAWTRLERASPSTYSRLSFRRHPLHPSPMVGYQFIAAIVVTIPGVHLTRMDTITVTGDPSDADGYNHGKSCAFSSRAVALPRAAPAHRDRYQRRHVDACL